MIAGEKIVFRLAGSDRWTKGSVYCSSDPGDSVLVRDAAGNLHFLEPEQVKKRGSKQVETEN